MAFPSSVACKDPTPQSDEYDELEAFMACQAAVPKNFVLIGKPKAGCSTATEALSQRLGLVAVGYRSIAARLLQYATRPAPEPEDGEEEAEEPAEGEEAPPKKEQAPFDPYEGLSDAEKAVAQAIVEGTVPDPNSVEQLLQAEIQKPEALHQGYVLDASHPGVDFSVVVDGAPAPTNTLELATIDEESLFRSSGKHIPVPPADPVPPPKPEGEEGEEGTEEAEEEEEEEEEETPAEEEEEGESEKPQTYLEEPVIEWSKILNADSRLVIPFTEEQISSAVSEYATIKEAWFDKVASGLPRHAVAVVDALMPAECVIDAALVAWQIEGPFPLRHTAQKLSLGEDGPGDDDWASQWEILSKSSEDGNDPLLGPRVLSPWARTDVVEWSENGTNIVGKGSLAACYMHRVFTFSTKDALDRFIAQPSKFLSKPLAGVPSRVAFVSFCASPLSGDNLSSYKLQGVYAASSSATASSEAATSNNEMVAVDMKALLSAEWQDASSDIGKALISAAADGGTVQAGQCASVASKHLGMPPDVINPPEAAPEAEGEEGGDGEAQGEQDIPSKPKGPGASAQFSMLNYPRTADDVAELKKRELLPECVVIFEPSVEDEEDPEPEAEEEPEEEAEGEDGEEKPPKPEPVKPTYSADQVPETVGKNTAWPFGPSSLLKAEARDGLAAALEEAGVRVVRIPITSGGVDEAIAAASHAVDPNSEQVLNIDGGELPEDGVWLEGVTSRFCPVSLRRESKLLPGKSDFTVTFKRRVYRLFGEEEAAAFARSPSWFAPSLPDSRCPGIQAPPAFVCVIGPKGSGKTELSQSIVAENAGLELLNIQQGLEMPEEEAARIQAQKDAKAKAKAEAAAAAAAAAAEAGEPEPEPEEEEEEPEEEPEVAAKRKVGYLSKRILDIFSEGKGLVLEGMPPNAEETAAILEAKLLPEVLLYIEMDEEQAVSRLFVSPGPPPPPELEEDEEPPAPMTREELLEAIAERDEARKQEIRDEHAAASESVSAFVEALGSLNVVCNMLNGNAARRRVLSAASRRLAKAVASRDSLLVSVKEISTKVASAQLKSGLLIPSKLRLQCPVAVSNNSGHFLDICQARASCSEVSECILPAKAACSYLQNMYPVTDGVHVYFCSSIKARAQVCTSPAELLTRSTMTIRAPASAAICGPSWSGRSSAAKFTAKNAGVMLITTKRAVMSVLQPVLSAPIVLTKKMSAKKKAAFKVLKSDVAYPSALSTTTAEKGGINYQTIMDWSPPGQLSIESLCPVVAAVSRRTNGFVVDGMPGAPGHMTCARGCGIVLQVAAVLDADQSDVKQRVLTQKLRERASNRRNDVQACERDLLLAQARMKSEDDEEEPEEEAPEGEGADGEEAAPKMSRKERNLKSAQDALSAAQTRLEQGDSEDDVKADEAFATTSAEDAQRWNGNVDEIVSELGQERDIVLRVAADSSHSRHWVSSAVSSAVVDASRCMEAYQTAMDRGLSCQPISGLHRWRPKKDMVNRLSRFTGFCPVSWVRDGELVEVETEGNPHFGVQKDGVHYRCCNADAMAAFMSEPSKYADGPDLPTEKPAIIPESDAQAIDNSVFEYEGYCPVTLFDGPLPGAPAHTAVQRGIKKFVAKLEGKTFMFVDAARLARFMRKPWQYIGQKLPDNLPVRVEDLDMSSLPLTEYLEYTVVKTLTEGLVSAGTIKPVFPYADRQRSALQYMALYLLANNPNHAPAVAAEHQKNLHTFMELVDLRAKVKENASLFTEEAKTKFETAMAQGIKGLVKQ